MVWYIHMYTQEILIHSYVGTKWNLFSHQISSVTHIRTNLDLYLSIGIIVNSPQGKKVCRAIILQVSADLPARSRLANIKQFNGCLFCENPGSTLPTNQLQIWPDVPHSQLRSHKSIMKNASDATSKQQVISIAIPASLYPSRMWLCSL